MPAQNVALNNAGEDVLDCCPCIYCRSEAHRETSPFEVISESLFVVMAGELDNLIIGERENRELHVTSCKLVCQLS